MKRRARHANGDSIGVEKGQDCSSKRRAAECRLISVMSDGSGSYGSVSGPQSYLKWLDTFLLRQFYAAWMAFQWLCEGDRYSSHNGRLALMGRFRWAAESASDWS